MHVDLDTPGRPPIAYAALLVGDASAAFTAWSLGDDPASIVFVVLAVICAAAVLAFLGVVLFRSIRPRIADEGLFLNGAFFFGVAAFAGSKFYDHHDGHLALGMILGYSALGLGAASVWLGLRAEQRAAGAIDRPIRDRGAL